MKSSRRSRDISRKGGIALVCLGTFVQGCADDSSPGNGPEESVDSTGGAPEPGPLTGGRVATGGSGGRTTAPGPGGSDQAGDRFCSGEVDFTCQEEGQVVVRVDGADPMVLNQRNPDDSCVGEVRADTIECKGRWSVNLSAYGETAVGGAGGAGDASSDQVAMTSIRFQIRLDEDGFAEDGSKGDLSGSFESAQGEHWRFEERVTLTQDEDEVYSFEGVVAATDEEGGMHELSLAVSACPGEFLVCAI